MIVTILLVIVNVITRKLFNYIIIWSEEIATSCFVYSVFIGAAYAYRKHQHVGVDLLVERLPAGARVSVTHDNGTEFAHHERLRDGLGMATYFADPYSSWQRGSNENRNGMIRRYLPKRCEIRMDMAKEVREIVDEINNRPMRVLGYRTPAEAFADELLELQDQQGCCTSK